MALGLYAAPTQAPKAFLMSRCIGFPAVARRERQNGRITHEVAHYLLRLWGLPDTEALVDYLAAALLLPAPFFARDLDEYGPNLYALRLRHPNVSASMLLLRVRDLRGGRFSAWEKGQLRWEKGYGPRGPAQSFAAVCRDAWRHHQPRGLFGLTGAQGLAWPLAEGWVVGLEG